MPQISSLPAPVERRVRALSERVYQAFEAAYDAGRELDALIAVLQAEPPAPAPLDLGPYTAPQITAAVVALQDRRTALVRTGVNKALEARNGGRRGHVGAQDRVGNGHAKPVIEIVDIAAE
jgi:hypothetical protein